VSKLLYCVESTQLGGALWRTRGSLHKVIQLTVTPITPSQLLLYVVY